MNLPNLSPEVMAAMQEQVAKMTPAQLEAMMAATKGVDLGAAQAAAAAHLASATPEDIRRAGAAMAGASPEAMTAGMAQAAARLKYEVDASGRLKAEGNAAFARGDAAAAAAAWGRAADNLKAHTTPEAAALRRACGTNLALAHLKLGAHAEAEAAAGAVLAEEPGNVKALLRRGTARLEGAVAAKGEGGGAADKRKALKRAVADLAAALAGAAPGDKDTVASKLAEAEAALAAEAAAGAAGAADGEGGGVASDEDEEAGEVEEAVAPPPAAPAAAPFAFPPGGMGGLAGGAGGPAGQAAQMRAFAAALRADPGLKAKVSAAAAGMDASQLAAAARAAGAAAPPPEALTPEALAAASSAMATMTPEQLEAMADALEKQGGGGGGGGGGPAVPAVRAAGSAAAAAAAAADPPPPPLGDVAALMKDPAMLKQAAAMLKGMDPATLAAMSGGAVTAEAAAEMKEKLGGMSDEALVKMIGAAQKVQAVAAKVREARDKVRGAPAWLVWAVVALLVAVVGKAVGWL